MTWRIIPLASVPHVWFSFVRRHRHLTARGGIPRPELSELDSHLPVRSIGSGEVRLVFRAGPFKPKAPSLQNCYIQRKPSSALWVYVHMITHGHGRVEQFQLAVADQLLSFILNVSSQIEN